MAWIESAFTGQKEKEIYMKLVGALQFWDSDLEGKGE